MNRGRTDDGESGSRRSRPIYVETSIACRRPGDIDLVWHRTQDLAHHVRWDLRFTHIDPAVSEQRDGDEITREFRYQVRLPGRWGQRFAIEGSGWSVGNRRSSDGRGTSALKFAPDSGISPMGPGSGYWRYEPTEDGMRFLTGYDYTPGWSILGRAVDPWLVRPLIGWATAWSFDRLRLWIDEDVDPARSRNTALALGAARTATAGLGLRALSKLVRRPGKRIPGLLLAGGLITASIALPNPRHVPSAKRCLRRPPVPARREP